MYDPEYNARYKREHREQIRAYNAKYRAEKREKVRKINQEWYKKARPKPDPLKVRAQHALQRALKNRKVVKPWMCDFCQKEKYLQGHHFDYSRPLSVLWLCVSCHVLLHQGVVVTPEGDLVDVAA